MLPKYKLLNMHEQVEISPTVHKLRLFPLELLRLYSCSIGINLTPFWNFVLHKQR